MNFWIINAQENPADKRSSPGRREWRSNTLCEILADRGHDVLRWRSAFSHQAKEFLHDGNGAVALDNYTQRYIACPPYKRHVGIKRILNHRALRTNFLKIARSGPSPQLIHVGNVPIELAHGAVQYGKEVGCPVIMDIRDLWPDIYVDLLPEQFDFLRGPLLNGLKLFSLNLKWAMRNATGITALTDAYMDWALDLAERERLEADAVFAMCYPRREDVPSEKALSSLRARIGAKKGDIIAAYLGNIGYQSDFELVMEGAAQLASKFPNFRLVIAGSGPKEDALRRLSASMPNVEVPGWLHGEEIAALLCLSSIGLIAFHPVPNYLKNIPNKYSEYLAGGMAVSCGLGGEMGCLTEQYRCGFVYEPGSVSSFCKELEPLLSAPELLAEMGGRSKLLHREKFDSAKVYPAFADYLETMAAKNKNSKLQGA